MAHRLGVAPATLRTWARRYDLGPSEHAAGAHRRYTAADVARLEAMRRLTLEGVPPAEAARVAHRTQGGAA
ncbi:MAG TPA: MerR family transcriptional regulator, partial [Mycobacteriales bacterium]|nr:MerR family transcriptional regulator [Mycobacteriales bacterium]